MLRACLGSIHPSFDPEAAVLVTSSFDNSPPSVQATVLWKEIPGPASSGASERKQPRSGKVSWLTNGWPVGKPPSDGRRAPAGPGWPWDASPPRGAGKRSPLSAAPLLRVLPWQILRQRRLRRGAQCSCSEEHLCRRAPFAAAIHTDRRTGSASEQEEDSTKKMPKTCLSRGVILVPLILVVGLISTKLAKGEEESGTAIPAESRPCVDCHAFEFMQRALQDLKKTAYNLDTRTNNTATL
ncbi:neuropeptide-like protein C4orf48 homolog isoform X2 [Sphaerodactylus townsendi]|uniref:neuropeptide-like protein C4orf48 homolog isoform X2 n=1 Tax=Sphaerodactylus townsendi TaxID=933632 RepID=UPI0020274A0D|nr:neuropeptide-like protein C4orf48 homolog isoform X2 [Sphaerodactylus townsendi]